MDNIMNNCKSFIKKTIAAVGIIGAVSLSGIAQAKDFVKIATGNVGGTYYPVGVAMGKLFSDELPNVISSAMSTGGSVDNIGLLNTKDAQLAVLSAQVTLDAYSGTGQFETRKFDKLRAITSMWPSLNHIVVSNEIKSFEDLKGTRFVVGASRSGTEVDAHAVLSNFGIFYREHYGNKINIDPIYVNYGEAVNLMKNGQVSGGLFDAAPPGSAISQLMATGDFHILQLTEAQVTSLTGEYPIYGGYTIKAGTYPKQGNDIYISGYPAILVTSTDVKAELVYDLTKTIFNNLPKLNTAHKATRFIQKDTASKGLKIPLHEGAKKYLTEIGSL